MIKLNNNFTTQDQSTMLLKLGVPADSADCCFYLNTNYSDKPYILYKKLSEKQADYDSPFSSIKAILYPCWSVGRLIEIMFKCTTSYDELTLTAGNYSINYVLAVFEDAAKYGSLDFNKLND